MDFRKKKVGVLGGGQLGRMMYEAVLKWDLDIHFMDKSLDFPVGKVCPQFHIGDFSNYDDVMNFGKDKDILTIEIEAVNLDALKQLKKDGVSVHPSPDALKVISDKGLQKMFYESNNIPSSDFQLFANVNAIKKAIDLGEITFPFVQKVRKGGYDGKGVSIIKNEDSLVNLLEGPSLIEDLVDIHKEIGIIVARNEDGETKTFDPVEMVFDNEANLVDYLFAPADINEQVLAQASQIAKKLISGFDICGLLAIEFFLTKAGELLVNEVAPRTHNSGHHTIEACVTSQFEQHIRAVMNMPLGATGLNSPALMINLLGSPGHEGLVHYEGMQACLNQENVHLHFYGKTQTKPSRKMGHITILDKELDSAKEKAKFVKETLKVTT